MNRFYYIFFLLFAILLMNPYTNIVINAESLEGFYNQGNALYRKGDYKEAIKKYQEALNFNFYNPDLFYNLANAYFRNGELGKSIQFYEKALRFKPRDLNIKTNLELAKQVIEDHIDLPPKNIIERVILKYYYFFSSKELILLTSIFFGTGFMMFFFMVISKRRRTKYLFLGLALIIFSIDSIFFITMSIKVTEHNSREYAVILANEINVKSGPKEIFTTVFTLHEGTKVMVRETRENWYFISLPNGMNGWLPKSTDSNETLGMI